jgi:hypothetical protein
MLKDVSPEERLNEIDRHFGRLDLFVVLGVLVGVVVLKGEGWDAGIWSWLFLVFLLILSKVLSFLLWTALVFWLGRLKVGKTLHALSHPNFYRTAVQSFLETWWENEVVLGAFVVLFRTTFCLWMYYVLSPRMGLQ